MTQTKTLARHFKSAAFTSLALSSLAGGVVLSGGHALASGNMDPGPATIIFTDPSFPGITFSDTATLVQSTGVPGTRYDLELTGLKYPFSQKQIDTDFNPPLTGGPVTSVYEITTSPTTPFDQVDLSWVNVPGPGAPSNVSAKYDFFSGGTLLGSQILNTNGAIYPLPFLADKIVVTNTYTPGDSAIDNAQNTFRNVPGPLPILGAGAAFGFSRKLRGRIKASRTA